MKYKRQEYRSPLDQWQQFPGAVNEKYSPLERFGTVEQTRIGREVNRHVQAERNNAQQGVNSPNEKLMAKKKLVSVACALISGAHGLSFNYHATAKTVLTTIRYARRPLSKP